LRKPWHRWGSMWRRAASILCPWQIRDRQQ